MPAQDNRHRQHGLSLIELMLSLTIGLLVVLAATTMLLQARAAYEDLDDAARVQETGRMAINHLAQALRQAGHLPWEMLTRDEAPSEAGLAGLDNHLDSNADTPALAVAKTDKGINGSDLLMIGLSAAPRGASGDVINCSGATAATVAELQSRQVARDWIFYSIALGVGNEPELRCRYRGDKGSWTSQGIARGVEAMQLHYALDSDGDGHPDIWRDASQIGATDWRRVRLVRLSLLVRGEARRPASGTARTYDLFSDTGNASDAAWRFTEPAGEQRRRAVFQTTVFLRNLTS